MNASGGTAGAHPASVLLDTHVLLWMLRDPARLSGPALEVLRDSATEIAVSAASAWEIATKHRIGKLPGTEQVLSAYSAHLSRLRVVEIPVTSEHALLAGGLDWPHRDPFDRVIAAQAIVGSLPLVTADPAFQTLSGIRTLWD